MGKLVNKWPKNAAIQRTPLHIAAIKDSLEILLQFLKLHGVDPNVKDRPTEYTALHYAASKGHIAMTHLLLKYSADKNARDKKKNTPMMLAASNGHSKCIKALIDQGANPDFRNGMGLTALIISILRDHTRSALMLIKLGANLSIADNGGNTPLHLAAVQGNEQVVKFLIRTGANALSVNVWGATPLDEAFRCMGSVAMSSKARRSITKEVKIAWKHGRKLIGLNTNLDPQQERIDLQSPQPVDRRDNGSRQGLDITNSSPTSGREDDSD